MKISWRKTLSKLSLVVVTIWLFMGIAEGYVEARASSGGSRGSRTYQSPTRPSQPAQPTQPRRESAPPSQQPSPVAPQPGGFMRGLAGGLLGGFLGSLLFSGFGAGGMGLMGILLLVGLGYLAYSMMRRSAVAPGYDTTEYQGAGNSAVYPASDPEVQQVDEPDFSSIRILDHAFDPAQFVKTAQDIFFKAQAAWARQDVAAVTSLCAPDLARAWEQELIEIRARGRRNYIENIALRVTEITEVWTESGQDYITVRFEANLLDYTIDEKTGQVVTGSRLEPVEFEEFWTFTRPVGPNTWKLTAVQQP